MQLTAHTVHSHYSECLEWSSYRALTEQSLSSSDSVTLTVSLTPILHDSLLAHPHSFNLLKNNHIVQDKPRDDFVKVSEQ